MTRSRLWVTMLASGLLTTVAVAVPVSAGSRRDTALERAGRAYEEFQYQPALEIVERALSQRDRSAAEKADLHALRGLVLYVMGNREAAEREFETAIGLDAEVELRENASPKILARFQEIKETVAAPAPSTPPVAPETPAELQPQSPAGDEVVGWQPPEPASQRIWTWAAAGTGGAALVVGAVFGVRADQHANESRRSAWADDVSNLRDQAEQEQLAANILFATGGVLLTGAVALFFLEGD